MPPLCGHVYTSHTTYMVRNGDAGLFEPPWVCRYWKSSQAVRQGADTAALDLASPYSRQLQLSTSESALVSAAISDSCGPACCNI